MEEKINNQKIFNYVPSLVARLILNSSLQDKDIFSDNSNTNQEQNTDTITGKQSKGKSTFLTSFSINQNLYPINHNLPNTIVMNIRLKGFQKLISTLSVKDPNDQREKVISEYLSITTPKLLLKISKILSNNGGEIIKYNDYEFTTIWNFVPKKNKLQRYEKFYAKQALLSACQIMEEIDNKEITSGIKIKISIGLAMGQSSIGFFGGERKRGEYIVMGEAIQKAEICLNYCLSHEIIISKEIHDLFSGSDEISTKEVDNEEKIKLYLISKFNEEVLKNLKGFKIKMKSEKINMTKSVYENLARKVYIFSSILPQGLVKYLDVGQDHNLKEISVVTIATIHILINKNLINNLKRIQNIILDIQKATYLTFGSLLYISKTYNGLLARCVWGMDPGSFVDDTARCISACILIGSLTEHYDIKIAIGIATGACYTGLIHIQGDKKQFTLLGTKVNLSRTLADEAFQKIINSNNSSSVRRKYVIYCDKKTMKQSQKWFRHVYVGQIKIYFNKESQELYYEKREEFDFNNTKTEKVENDYQKKISSLRNDNYGRNNSSLLGEYNRKSIDLFKKSNTINDALIENTYVISTGIYSPIDNEIYFLQNNYDPFPFIRTHKNNCFSCKISQYYYNHFRERALRNKLKLHLIGNLPMPNVIKEEEKEKVSKILQKSQVIYGYDEEIIKFVNIMNIVTQKSKKQFILVKGPLGVGKSLFLRTALIKYLDKNEELKNIYYNKDDLFLCGIVDPLTATFPFNTFCFILRKMYLHLKKMNELNDIFKLCNEIHLDDENIKSINFVLSMGKKDIDITNEFPEKRKNTFNNNDKKLNNENISVISELEGPHKIKDTNKINYFFFEIIKLYKFYLNKKYNDPNNLNKSSSGRIRNKAPLILLIDDAHMSDKYSIEFIKYIFSNDDIKVSPLIVILVEQTPFNINYRPILHRELEFFLTAFTDLEDNEKIDSDKILLFELKPIMEKELLKNIIAENFEKYVKKNYNLPKHLIYIDNKIMDFLLKKTFLGIPLLVIELFDSLLKSQKFIKMNDNEFRITQDLIDDNDTFDWSNLLLPYIYEKITSMTINSLLSFKEILLLKYACTIGTIFDIQTLDKINPLNLIIKREDLNNIMEKLCNEYIIEVFGNENMNKKYLICKICFPLMREVLHNKFLIERIASLHSKTAKLLSGGKKIYYFNSKVEGKILKRHLIYSEIDIVHEIESKTNKVNEIDLYNPKRIMNTNNLAILNVKNLCSRIFMKNNKNVSEGILEMSVGSKWVKINYNIDKQWKIYFNKIKTNKNEKDLEIIVPIKDIFKNKILDNNVLEITIAEYSSYLLNKSKKIMNFRSDNWQDIFQLDTALTFLKMIANYERYMYNFGYTRLPLFKKDWYAKKEKKYYINIVQNPYYDGFRPFRTKRFYSCSGQLSQTDKLILESKDLNKPFNVIMRIALTLFLANIQLNLTKNRDYLKIDQEEDEHRLINGKVVYLIFISTPPHMNSPLKKLEEEIEKKQKEEEEMLRSRYKGKFSIFPYGLIKRERRIFGNGVVHSKRNQSIIMYKHPLNQKRNNEDDEIDQEKIRKVDNQNKRFIKRKEGKSKTVLDKPEISKEIGNKIKSTRALTFINLHKNESDDDSSSSLFSKNKSDSSDEEKSNNESDTSESEISKEENKDKFNDNINNIKRARTTINEDINDINENKLNDISNNIITDNSQNNSNLNKKINNNNNNNNNGFSKSDKNNVSINNYINNNININLINNDLLNSTLKQSLLNKKIFNNYYDSNLSIKINSLRMSYQRNENKLLIKLKQKINPKKSNSVEVKTLKEKYKNNSNYYLNSNHTSHQKISLDINEDESQISDKESDHTKTVITSPETSSKKKNSKIIQEITPSKEEDIFSKAVIAFLDEETDITTPNKEYNQFKENTIKKNVNKKKNSNAYEQPKDLGLKMDINQNRKKFKRSSLMPSIKVQFNNRKRHVTFTQKKEKTDQTKKDNYQNTYVPKKNSRYKDGISGDLSKPNDEINNEYVRNINFNDSNYEKK